VVAPEQLDRFIEAHRLPESFRGAVDEHFAPLARLIAEREWPVRPAILGINGAQGTGKSTLADFLQLALKSGHGWRVAVLSIDDFYLTKSERQALAATVHPLLATRGVPGTHDVRLLDTCLRNLVSLAPGEEFRPPRFDKATDDRADDSAWPAVVGPLDLIILEGWCIGSVAQPEEDLESAVNKLERDSDIQGDWRRYVNERLAGEYAALFSVLDALVFLQAPGFDAIFRWRLEQEQKLAASGPEDASGIMDEEQLAQFIQYFERITRHDLMVIGSNADIVLEFDEYHRCIASHNRT
jgi:D-glycerate 3-kinase